MEKTKLAFRSAYSLLDKIAFFLNDYLKLDIPLGAVSFRSLWFVKKDSTELKPAFTQAKNWPLRGFYWLAKDFVEDDFQTSTEPDARDVAKSATTWSTDISRFTTAIRFFPRRHRTFTPTGSHFPLSAMSWKRRPCAC